MNIKFYPLLLGLIFFTLIFNGCSEDEFIINESQSSSSALRDVDADIALAWNNLFLEVERYTPGYRPPVSARASAYIGLTAYEALMPELKNRYRAVVPQIADLDMPQANTDLAYDWEIVLNAAYERIFGHFFASAPTNQQHAMTLLADSIHAALEVRTSTEIRRRSIDYGYAVADVIYDWAKTDAIGHGSHERNSDPNYQAPEGPGYWQPTYPDFLAALTPYWGEVRTFAGTDHITAEPPLSYSEDPNSEIYAQALEVQQIVNDIKENRRQEDRWIAEFWSDDCPILTFTPSARWIAIANQVIEKENIDLGKAVYVYAKMGIALNDAGVRCWAEKYRYSYLRPIDYIRNVLNDQDWNTVMCPDGSGRYFTPNFPAYPSGHAAFGAAAAEVLASAFGYHYTMTDRSHEGRTEFLGTPRTFNSFAHMARENAYSRVPLGVHFSMDADSGLDIGKRIGQRVNSEIIWHSEI